MAEDAFVGVYATLDEAKAAALAMNANPQIIEAKSVTLEDAKSPPGTSSISNGKGACAISGSPTVYVLIVHG